MKRKQSFPVRRGDPKTGTIGLAHQAKQEVISSAEVSIRDEIDHIVACASKGEGRVVMLGSLVFFSTESQDAWMLDAEDGRAAPLCRGGSVQTAPMVVETSNRFAIRWPLDFRLEGDEFVTEDRNTGRIVRVSGYPVAAIAGALENARCQL